MFPTVWESVGRPSSATTLLRTLRNDGIPATLAEAKSWLSHQTVKQLFAPLPKSDGHVTASSPGERVAADLIDMTSRPSDDGMR